MRLSTWAAVVCFAPWQLDAYGDDVRLIERATTVPAPLNVAPSQYWYDIEIYLFKIASG